MSYRGTWSSTTKYYPHDTVDATENGLIKRYAWISDIASTTSYPVSFASSDKTYTAYQRWFVVVTSMVLSGGFEYYKSNDSIIFTVNYNNNSQIILSNCRQYEWVAAYQRQNIMIVSTSAEGITFPNSWVYTNSYPANYILYQGDLLKSIAYIPANSGMDYSSSTSSWVIYWTPYFWGAWTVGMKCFYMNTMFECQQVISQYTSDPNRYTPPPFIRSYWAAPNYDGATMYQPDSIVFWNPSNFRLMTVVGTQGITPTHATTLNATWISIWNNQASYTSGIFIFHTNWDLYYANTGSNLLSTPNAKNTTGEGWIFVGTPSSPANGDWAYVNSNVSKYNSTTSTWDPVSWSATVNYSAGATVPYNSFSYYTTQSVTGGSAPARNTTTTAGWIRVYASAAGQDYLQNEFIYHTATTALYRAFDAVSLGTAPTAAKTSLTGWIPVDSSSTSVGQYSWRTSGSNWQNYTSGGWVNAWYSGQNYAANTQLAYLGYQYVTRSAQNNTSAPSAVTSSLTSWIPFWQSTSYSTGNLVYQSSVYYIVAGATTSANTPASPNTTGTLWIPIWASGSYSTGNYVSDGTNTFIAASAVTAANTPGNNTTGQTGWVPLWKSGNTYSQGQYVYNSSAYYFAFNSNVVLSTTTPVVANTTGNGWVTLDSTSTTIGHYSYKTSTSKLQVYVYKDGTNQWQDAWLTGQNYTSNTIVGHLGFAYATRVAQSNVAAPAGNTTSLSSWIPYWTATSYSTGNVVYQGSVYYIAAGATTSGNTPASPNTTGTLWIPVWASGSYSSNSFVTDGTNTYIAASAVTSANTLGPNTTGKTAWVPLWKSGNTYSQGQYTYNSGAYYFAYNSNVILSTTTPVIANTTGNGWVTLDSTSTTVGHYSYKTSTSKLQAYVNQDGVNTWIDAWQSTPSYSANTILAYLTKAYVTRGAQSAGVTPSTNTSNLNDWIPYWIAGTYSQNHLVYRNGVYYVNNDVSTTATPASPNTTGTAWVPLWSNLSYNSNNFVAANGITYIAATNVTSNDTPIINTTGKNGWVPTWKSGNSYAQGHYVYYNSNYYYASDNTNLSTTTPAVTNTSGWIIVGIPQTPSVGNIALVGSNVQSFVPVGSTNTWVNAWAASNVDFTPGTVVSSSGRAYAALKPQASNSQPALVKNNINSWIPVWTSNDVNYDPLNYTYHNGRFFVSPTAFTAYAQPTVNVSNLNTWVTVWDSNIGFSNSSYVFGDKSLAFYQAKSNVPINHNITPENDKQEQYWKMSSIPLAGSLSLTRLRGLILSRVNN